MSNTNVSLTELDGGRYITTDDGRFYLAPHPDGWYVSDLAPPTRNVFLDGNRRRAAIIAPTLEAALEAIIDARLGETPGINLTPAQQRLLVRVRRAGVLRQNGRARRTVEALVAAGLVTADYDVEPRADGRHAESFTLYPVEPV